jgi:hypothetical protein
VHAERVGRLPLWSGRNGVRSLQIMKSRLLIVADLGLVKAYKLDFTPNHTPRLEQVEEIALEEAHSRLLDKVIRRLIERSGCDVCWLAAHKEINQKILDELPPAVCHLIKKNLPRDLTKVGQKELLDQFLNADALLI